MRENLLSLIKESPGISAAILGSILLSIGIMGITGSFWAGIITMGISTILGAAIYAVVKY